MKKLVIIGGGFAGAKIAKTLEKEFETTLIDTKDYFEFTPGILRAIVSPTHLKKIQVKHSKYLSKTKIIKSKIIELNKKEILTNEKEILPYDFLAICSGSKYSSPIKKENILIVSRGEEIKKYHKKISQSKNISIIGGGIVGVELAAEIAENFPEKSLTIVHQNQILIPRNHKKSSKISKQFLGNKNVKIIFGEKAIKKSEHFLETNKGTKIKSDIIFICTGIKPNSQFMIPKMKEKLNEKEFIKVNKFLQVENEQNIFAIGDVNSILVEKTAQNAEKQASIAIKNILALNNNQQLKEYQTKKRPMVISLGKWNGIFEYKNLAFGGILPAFMKWFVEKKTIIKYNNQ